MIQLRKAALFFAVALPVLATAVAAKVITAPLSAESYDVGQLFPAAEQAIAIQVVDARDDQSLVGGGIVGPKGDKGKGILLLYTSERDPEVQELLAKAAEQASGILGFKAGQGGLSFELRMTDLWIDMYRFTGFSPMNCLGYVGVSTRLANAAGDELARRDFRLTYFENTSPVASMKEVTREAVSRILMQAAWQATAQTLIEALKLEARAEQLEALASKVDGIQDEIPARQAIFWLGLAGRNNGTVAAKLRILLGSEHQRVHTAAAEALGLAGVGDAKTDLEAVIGGARRGGWDMTDLEHVWYLAKALHLLGEGNVKAKLATKDLEPASKLDDALHFLQTGEAPQLSDAEKEKLAKALPKVAKKRKD